MLEERLSSTYAQHTLGAYDSIAPSQPSQAPANVYPSMSHPGPSGQGGAESFYLGKEPSQSGPHARAYAQTQPSGTQYPDETIPPHMRSSSVVSGSGTYAHPQWPQHADFQRQSWNQGGEKTPQVASSHTQPPIQYSGTDAVSGNPYDQTSAESYYNNQAGHEPSSHAQRSSSISEYSSSPVMTRNPPSQQPPTPLPPNHSHTTATPPSISKQPSYPVQGTPHGASYQPSPDVMAPQGQPPGGPQTLYSWQPPAYAGQQSYAAAPGTNGTGAGIPQAAAAAGPPPQHQYYHAQPVQPKPVEESLIEL